MKKNINAEISYNFDDKPNKYLIFPLAFQHLLAMFLANITIPILVGNTMEFTYEKISFLIQCALFCSGIATLIQVNTIGIVGSKLPIIMGTSNAFIGVILAITKDYNIETVLGAALFGSIIEIFIGYNLKRLKKMFTPIVSGIIVLTIGITLLPLGFIQSTDTSSFNNSLISISISSLVLITIVFFNISKIKSIKNSAILLGIIVGYIVSFFLGKLPLNEINLANYFSIPIPYIYKLEFRLAPIIAMFFMFIATSIETIGDISAITMTAQNREPNEDELRGGVIADGIGSLLSCFFNAFPNTSYTQNIGVMTLTGVFSRAVVNLSGILLVFLAFFPKIATLLAIIPKPVLGGASIAMFSMIVISGITILRTVEFTSRNILIISISVGIGSGLALAPEYTNLLNKDLQFILTSGVVPAGVIGIILNLILPKDK